MSSLWICAVLVYHICTWCQESYKPSVFWSLLLFELDWQTRHCSILSYAKLPIWRVIITRQSVLWRIFTVRCTVYAMAKWQAVCRCMSVTCRCCIEMPKHIIPQLTPHSNSGTLVFLRNSLCWHLGCAWEEEPKSNQDVIQSLLSYDQLWAATLIGRNVITWHWP